MTDDDTPPTTDAQDELIEALAAVEHAQWSSWARAIMDEEDLSADRVARWEGLLCPYEELPEEMRSHDRGWAREALEELERHGVLVDDLSNAIETPDGGTIASPDDMNIFDEDEYILPGVSCPECGRQLARRGDNAPMLTVSRGAKTPYLNVECECGGEAELAGIAEDTVHVARGVRLVWRTFPRSGSDVVETEEIADD